MPASLFVCGSVSLRRRALRPQLKRDPLGGSRSLNPSLLTTCAIRSVAYSLVVSAPLRSWRGFSAYFGFRHLETRTETVIVAIGAILNGAATVWFACTGAKRAA